jgi:hypothetical protein
MLWLYLIPTWLLGLIIVGGLTLVSVAMLYVVDPWIKKLPHPGNDIVYCFAAGTGVIYALVLGLFAVAAWDSLRFAEDTSMKEALQVGKLYLDLSGYPQPERDQLQPMLKQYLEHAINVEWPMQRKGQDPEDPALLSKMLDYWVQVEPKTEGQKIVHAEALRELNDLLSFRRARQDAVHTALPVPLWVTLLFGAFLNISLCYFIRTQRGIIHAILVALFAAQIGVMIFVIVAVDHPMWGDVSVSPDAYEQVLERLNSSTPAVTGKQHGQVPGTR